MREFVESLSVLADLFARYPVPFALVTTLVITLIYFKWVWIGRGMRQAHKNAYAGWKTGGTISDHGAFEMRPVKLLRIGLMTLVFFGGGGLFYAASRLPEGNLEPREILGFAGMCLFACLALWLIAMSFTRIRVENGVMTQTGLVARNMSLRLSDLRNIRPIGKTLAGGVFLEFEGGARLRIPANMSGYGQMLHVLAARDPKARAMVRGIDRALKDRL